MRFHGGESVRMLPYDGEIGLVTAAARATRKPLICLGETEQSYGVEYRVWRAGQGYDVRMREEELEPVENGS